MAWCLAVCGGIGVRVADARAQSESVALVVRARSNVSARCLDVDALQQRIAHYGAGRIARAEKLRLELYVDSVDSAELLVYRERELVSRRRFDDLPGVCVDRRDAVALSIALALEGVSRDPVHAREPNDSPPSGEETRAPGATAEMAEPSDRSLQAEQLRESTRQSRSSEEAPQPVPSVPAERVAVIEPAPTEDAREGGAGESQDNDEQVQEVSAAGGRTSSAPLVHLHLGGRWLAHALPSPVWTGMLGVELWLDPQFAIDLSAMASTIGSTKLAGENAETWLVGGELLGCSAFKLRDFEAQGCAGAVLAACRASGDYPVDPRPAATLLWAASTVRLALRWPDTSRVSLRVVLQGHVNVVRPELYVKGSREALYPFWLGGSAGLDIIVAME